MGCPLRAGSASVLAFWPLRGDILWLFVAFWAFRGVSFCFCSLWNFGSSVHWIGFVTTCSPSIHLPLPWCSSAPGVQERVRKEFIEHVVPGVAVTPLEIFSPKPSHLDLPPGNTQVKQTTPTRFKGKQKCLRMSRCVNRRMSFWNLSLGDPK